MTDFSPAVEVLLEKALTSKGINPASPEAETFKTDILERVGTAVFEQMTADQIAELDRLDEEGDEAKIAATLKQYAPNFEEVVASIINHL